MIVPEADRVAAALRQNHRDIRQPTVRQAAPATRTSCAFYASTATHAVVTPFQYPLFRIVGCFNYPAPLLDVDERVSISALSDRGLLHPINGYSGCRSGVSISALSDRGLLRDCSPFPTWRSKCFNIRSFGSWVASPYHRLQWLQKRRFNIRSFGSWVASDDRIINSTTQRSFNIRSFGSWVASQARKANRT